MWFVEERSFELLVAVLLVAVLLVVELVENLQKVHSTVHRSTSHTTAYYHVHCETTILCKILQNHP